MIKDSNISQAVINEINNAAKAVNNQPKKVESNQPQKAENSQPQKAENKTNKIAGTDKPVRRYNRYNRNKTSKQNNNINKTSDVKATENKETTVAVKTADSEKPKQTHQRNNTRNQRTNQPRKTNKNINTKAAETEIKTDEKPKAKTQTKPRNPRRNTRSNLTKKATVKIIPLGGLNEIGKNFTVIECSNDIFIIDCGLAFPDAEMPGVDIVIPDFTYVEKNKDKIRGIVVTHGHEDHIGGIPYLLKKINVPVYATRLTIGLIEGKLKEHGLLANAKLNEVVPHQTVKLGCMAVEFIRVNHSIPDAVGMAVYTPAGTIVYTGDFKVDYTPIEGGIIDLARFGELGEKGVLALMSDSTNSERRGFTMSESKVGESFEKLFVHAEGKRIIIATFASNIHRVQQIIDNAVRFGRKVAIFGRSMVNVMGKAIELGYLKVPDGVIIDIDTMNRYKSEQIVLITTGSQGEPMSALTRMAMNDHRKVSINSNDFIIISATPIPGNEKFVTKVVNELMKSGAEVIYEAMYDVHVSGHACQEEQKLILSLVKPKYFIPVHGEYKHLKHHAKTAMEMGVPESNIIIADIGNVIETDGTDMKITSQVPAGKVLVDGLGVGDVGAIVLRDRKHLAQDGLIICVATIESESGTILAGPDVVSRGFVYVRESEELMEEAKKILTKTLQFCLDSNLREWNAIKMKMKDSLSDFIYTRTKRNPMILPIIMEI